MKILTLIIALCFSLISFAQIEVKQKTELNSLKTIEEEIENTPYDSLENYPYKNLKGFIGQRLLMNLKNSNEYSEYAKTTYTGFYSDITINSRKTYKAIISNGNIKETKTDINALYGKYFTYIGYEITNSYNYPIIYLKLIDDNNDTLYYQYLSGLSSWTSKPQYNFPFITEGYYKKALKNKGRKVQSSNNLYNCIDVYVEENSNELTYLLEIDGKTESVTVSNFRSVIPFRTLKIKSDSTYLSEQKSTFTGISSSGKKVLGYITSNNDHLDLMFLFEDTHCFETDDKMIFNFSNGGKFEEYYRGNFNCKGSIYLEIDVTIESHIKWIENLISQNLKTVLIYSSKSNKITITPSDYLKIRESIKAHYNKIIK